MACFITPLVVGIATLIASKLQRTLERFKLNILAYMLLGGALVLAVEHVWHGEVVPYPPFLTAMQNPEDIPVMLHEMSVVGGSMTLATTALWSIIVLASRKLEVKAQTPIRITTTLK